MVEGSCTHLSKVSGQPHLAALSQWPQDAAVAHKQLHRPLRDPFCAVKDEVHALEVTEVIRHHSGDEALQLLHVQGTRHIWFIRAANRPATHTRFHNYPASTSLLLH